MNTQEKSLKLAELMGWKNKPSNFADYNVVQTSSRGSWSNLTPYNNTRGGLAQFAAILLKFPEVMTIQTYVEDWPEGGAKPTQESLLDNVLQHNGVEL